VGSEMCIRDSHSPKAFSAGFTHAVGVAAALSFLAAITGMWQPARGDVGSRARGAAGAGSEAKA